MKILIFIYYYTKIDSITFKTCLGLYWRNNMWHIYYMYWCIVHYIYLHRQCHGPWWWRELWGKNQVRWSLALYGCSHLITQKCGSNSEESFNSLHAFQIGASLYRLPSSLLLSTVKTNIVGIVSNKIYFHWIK